MMGVGEISKCYINQFYADRIILFEGDANYFGVKCTEDTVISLPLKGMNMALVVGQFQYMKVKYK